MSNYINFVGLNQNIYDDLTCEIIDPNVNEEYFYKIKKYSEKSDTSKSNFYNDLSLDSINIINQDHAKTTEDKKVGIKHTYYMNMDYEPSNMADFITADLSKPIKLNMDYKFLIAVEQVK